MSEQVQGSRDAETDDIEDHFDPWENGIEVLPSPERQMELRLTLGKNIEAGRPPCAGVELRSPVELSWVRDIVPTLQVGGPDHLTQQRPDLREAIIFSITSFHGRGFNPSETVILHNPLTIFAALEAIIGLLIEVTFIATFTQRFFAR